MSEIDRDDRIRAKVLAKLHRNGFYDPSGVSIDGITSMAVASHDQGRAKELVRDMAADDAYPVTWKHVGEAVFLEQDSTSWVAACIRRHDEEQLPWNL